MITAPALALLALAAPQDSPPGPSAVAREWQARAWALDPARHTRAIAGALEHEDWSGRHLALDALARVPAHRAEALARHRPALQAALEDPHPNVRAAALAVFAAAGESPPPDALSLARDPLPSVRVQLAEALGRAEPTPRSCLTLLALARGGGEAGVVATRGLLTAGPAGAAQQLELLAPGGVLDEGALLEAVPRLLRAPIATELVDGLRGLQRGAPVAGTLIEALALHAELDGAPGAPTCDRERLVAGWLALEPGDFRHEVLWRELLVTVAREGDERLGRQLMRAATELAREDPAPLFPDHALQGARLHGDGELAATFLAECAAEALDPPLAIELATDLPEVLAGEVWARIAPRVQRIEPRGAARWLAPAVSDELRFGVASVVADVFSRAGDAGAEKLLVALLEDRDSGLRRASFRWLCNGPRLAARLPLLHAAWSTYEPEERALHLRSLPREQRPEPFRDDLLRLCGRPANRTGAFLELLGTFDGDREVQGALRRWLEEELVGLEGAASYEAWYTHESRAEALVRALGSSAIPELADALARALRVSPPRFAPSPARHDPRLTKAAAALLGATVAGRARLAGHLGPGVENRTRIEAGIQILLAGDPRAARDAASSALSEGYARCDSELGVRVLEALGRGSDAEGEALLRMVAGSEGAGLELRLAAVEALGRRRSGEGLILLLDQVRHPEARAAIAMALARLGEPRESAALRVTWERVRARLGTRTERPEDAYVVGELLVALLAAEELGPEERGWLLAGPLAAAAADAGARFRADRTAATAFRWRAELTAAELLARRGELGAVLEGSKAWWRLDGDLLLALARAAHAAGETGTARRVLDAAEVASAGERPGDGWWNRRADIALTQLEWAADAGEHAAVARVTTRLWGDQRLIERRIARIEDVLGLFDRREGVDPVANLDAGRWQARAWVALAAGRSEEARRCGTEAERRVGASRAARTGQEELERALGR